MTRKSKPVKQTVDNARIAELEGQLAEQRNATREAELKYVALRNAYNQISGSVIDAMFTPDFAVKLRQQGTPGDNHPNRIENILKSWVLAFNKFGIGIKLLTNDVVFVGQDNFEMRVPYDGLLTKSMETVLEMMLPASRGPDGKVKSGAAWVHNYVQGTNGWRDPESLQLEKDAVVEKAISMLQRAGVTPADI
jgi:hypothetical protein